MTTVTLGYIGLAVLWAVVLTPIAIGLVHFFRTTSWSDLVPQRRVIRRSRA